ELMRQTRRQLEHALPFAMEPVVYDFAINSRGSVGELLRGAAALMPAGYYAQQVPAWLRTDPRQLPPGRREELGRFGVACRTRAEMAGMVETLFDWIFPRTQGGPVDRQQLDELLGQNGFDARQHEGIRADLRQGRIGLMQNRLPSSSVVQ